MEIEVSYTITLINNSEFKAVKHFTKDEYEHYSDLAIQLTNLAQHDGLYKIVELNYFEIITTTQNYVEEYSETGKFDMWEIRLNLNRLILNFLASVKTYLDHSLSSLKDDYGEDVLELFKKETSHAYDNNFAYRFLYKLRNYAQHKGLPASSISMTSKSDGKNGTNETFTLDIDRDALLEDNKWGIVKEELENKPAKFDIIPLVEEKYNLLNQIKEKINKTIFSKFSHIGNELLSLIKEVSTEPGIPTLVQYNYSPDGHHTLHTLYIPFEMVSEVTGEEIILYAKKDKIWNSKWPKPPLLSSVMRGL